LDDFGNGVHQTPVECSFAGKIRGSNPCLSNFHHRVPPNFLNVVPVNFHDRVPPDFHRCCATS